VAKALQAGCVRVVSSGKVTSFSVEHSDALVLEWLVKAAEGGHFGGQYELGRVYFEGLLGFSKSMPLALAWWLRADDNMRKLFSVKYELIRDWKDGFQEPRLSPCDSKVAKHALDCIVQHRLHKIIQNATQMLMQHRVLI
jgi:TPR repeat protein